METLRARDRTQVRGDANRHCGSGEKRRKRGREQRPWRRPGAGEAKSEEERIGGETSGKENHLMGLTSVGFSAQYLLEIYYYYYLYSLFLKFFQLSWHFGLFKRKF